MNKQLEAQPPGDRGTIREPESGFDLEHFLPYRLSLLANTVSQGIAHGYERPHGLNVTQWRVLAVLGRYPGSTASEIAERTAMDKVAISRAVAALESRQLLSRRTDGTDRRRQRLYVDEGPGQAVLHQVIPLARAYEAALSEALEPGELKLLNDLMQRLQQRAESLVA
jgi:DNA-binding MarR family transcriptional regulator